jgi:hypothetical protein
VTPALETGNAEDAGAASRGWFVGDLAAWAASRGESIDPASTLRQRTEIEVKWFVHPPRHERPARAEPDRCFSLGVLVDGDMRFEFHDATGATRAVQLARRGDYVLWHGPSFAHSWRSEGGCTFLTVRWPVRAGAEVATT